MLACFADPPLQPALLWPVCFEAALVADHPQDGEVGEDLAGEHRFEVELDVGGSGQAGVVPKEAEAPAVRQDRPEVVIGAVEELLDHGGRGGGGGAGDAFGASVEVDVGAEEVDGDRSPKMRDRVLPPVDGDRTRTLERPKPSSANSGSSQRSRVMVVARSPAGSLASSVANVVQAPWSSVQDRLMASRRRRPETRW